MTLGEREGDKAVRALRVVIAHLAITAALVEGAPKLENAANKLLRGAALLLMEVENEAD